MKCAPGTYSRNGVEPCTPCAKGSYQPGIGALACVECTGGKSTYGPGADAADMCVGEISLDFRTLKLLLERYPVFLEVKSALA